MMNLKRTVLGTLIVFAGLLLIGCPDGSLFDLLGGGDGPTPGDGGAISVETIHQTTIDISWSAASDETTTAADIEYQVYYATSDQFSTPEDAAANGSAVFANWTAATESATLTGLIPGTQYWMVVVARDADANMAVYRAASAMTASDTTAPTPGNSGAISVDAIDQTTIDISWTAATDDATPTADIEYQVYYSTADNIGTPETAAAGGTEVFTGWTAGAVAASVTGLARDSDYYVNVVARDLSANATAYTTAGVTTAFGPIIRLEEVGVRDC